MKVFIPFSFGRVVPQLQGSYVVAGSHHCRLILALLVALTPVLAVSQGDDPRYDNAVGLEHLPITAPIRDVKELMVITTSDGFDNFDLGITTAEPHMSSNPLNSLWYFNAFNTNNAFRTTDGVSWTFSQPGFGAGVLVRGDPVTAYDSLGNLYYETMYGSSIVGCKVIRSTDNGATWTPSVTSIAGVDKNWLACDQTMGPFANYVYTTMTTSPTGMGNFARSTDFGATWTTTFQPTTQSLPGMMVAVGPNVAGGNNISGGCVYVVTHSGTNAAGIYTFYRSTDGGLTFSQMSQHQFSNYIGTQVGGRSTVQFMRCRPYPFITADNSFGPNRGRLYLVYASNNPSGDGNKSDIFLRYSTDQGATWSPSVVVNDDPSSQNNFQFHPAIWCEKETGRLYVKWYDTRRVPTSDSMDVYATYTDDGGVSFAPNQRLTNAKFRINFTNATSATYRGDYDAITANPITSMAVWTDFRNSGYLGMTAYFPDFAMLVSPAADTLRPTDSMDVFVKVPDVKLYTHSARFSATVSPAGNFTFSYPDGDSLTTYPDSLRLKIRTDNVPDGTYTVTITGAGPNGTPVHRRTVRIVVRFVPNAVALQQPNGGEIWINGTNQNIVWTRSGDVDSVRLEYSTNNGGVWSTIASAVPAASPYSWAIPATPSTQALVRVTWLDSLNVTDQSNSVFSISDPTPLITTSPDSLLASLELGPNATTDTLAIGNTGTINLNWNLSESLPWLSASPNSGSVSPGNTQNVIVTFNATGQPAGVHTGDVTITSNDQFSSPTTIPARLTVVTIAAIQLSATSMNHGTIYVGDTTTQSLVIRNVGTGTLNLSSLSIANGNDYAAPADGDQVVPPVAGSGSGTGKFTLNGPGTQLSYNIRVAGLSGAVTVANFRAAIRGFNGNIVRNIPFAGDSAVGVWPNTGFQSLTPALVDSLKRGKLYVNIGTAANPNGEIRGQVDGSFFMNLSATSIPPNDSLTRFISFSPVASVPLTGTLHIVSNDPDPSDDTLFVSLSGTGQDPPVSVPETPTGIPAAFELGQNFPNPFNPSTHIHYGLPEEAGVSLKVFNLLGQEVVSLASGTQNAGYHTVEWNGTSSSGSQVGSGIYFYRFEAHSVTGQAFMMMRKMILLK